MLQEYEVDLKICKILNNLNNFLQFSLKLFIIMQKTVESLHNLIFYSNIFQYSYINISFIYNLRKINLIILLLLQKVTRQVEILKENF